MSAAGVNGRYPTQDSVRQRDKVEFPVSGRSRRPAIDRDGMDTAHFFPLSPVQTAVQHHI